MPKPINGILLLDKCAGMTSNAVLQKVKRLFNAEKAGHTGSLDPLATGMLPLCFGEATKFSQFLLESDKTYQVSAKLGVTTTTGDSEGELLASTSFTHITEDKLIAALSTFVGQSEQVPPMYSAIKHQGKPLYKLARQGLEIERKPRAITIYSYTWQGLQEDIFSFTVKCSKGTYVRTLVEDIAKKVSCGAHVCGLRRISVTPYKNSAMFTLDSLEKIYQETGIQSLYRLLLPIETAVQALPAFELSTATAFYLKRGQPVRASSLVARSFVRLIEEGNFIGIGEMGENGTLKPYRLTNYST